MCDGSNAILATRARNCGPAFLRRGQHQDKCFLKLSSMKTVSREESSPEEAEPTKEHHCSSTVVSLSGASDVYMMMQSCVLEAIT